MSESSSLTPGKSLESDLRLIREARGLTREDIFNRVHIRPEVLTQIEEFGFAATPTLSSDIHRRSFVKHYADAIHIDIGIALQALNESLEGRYDGSLAREYLGAVGPGEPRWAQSSSDSEDGEELTEEAVSSEESAPGEPDAPATSVDLDDSEEVTRVKLVSSDVLDDLPDSVPEVADTEEIPWPIEDGPTEDSSGEEVAAESDEPVNDTDEAEAEAEAEAVVVEETHDEGPAQEPDPEESAVAEADESSHVALEESESPEESVDKWSADDSDVGGSTHAGTVGSVAPVPDEVGEEEIDSEIRDSSEAEEVSDTPEEVPDTPEEITEPPDEAQVDAELEVDQEDVADAVPVESEIEEPSAEDSEPEIEDAAEISAEPEEPLESEDEQEPATDEAMPEPESTKEPPPGEEDREEGQGSTVEADAGKGVQKTAIIPESPYAPPIPGVPPAAEAMKPASDLVPSGRSKEKPIVPKKSIKPIEKSEREASTGSRRRKSSSRERSSERKESWAPMRTSHWLTWVGLLGVLVVMGIFLIRSFTDWLGHDKLVVEDEPEPVTVSVLPERFSGFIRLDENTEQFVTFVLQPSDTLEPTDFVFKMWTHSAGSLYAQTGQGTLSTEGNQVTLPDPYGMGGVFLLENGQVRIRSVRRVDFPRWELTGQLP